MVRVLALLFAVLLAVRPAVAAEGTQGLTAVEGIKVGHFTLKERPTGCTVVLTEAGATAGVDVRGGAPGTRETDLLDPVNHVEKINAIVLSGGSAFGLDAASGVVRYLDERNIGYDARVARVPIVPAAILFDLGVGEARRSGPPRNAATRRRSRPRTAPWRRARSAREREPRSESWAVPLA